MGGVARPAGGFWRQIVQLSGDTCCSQRVGPGVASPENESFRVSQVTHATRATTDGGAFIGSWRPACHTTVSWQEFPAGIAPPRREAWLFRQPQFTVLGRRPPWGTPMSPFSHRNPTRPGLPIGSWTSTWKLPSSRREVASPWTPDRKSGWISGWCTESDAPRARLLWFI